jgi:hypothetical protein
MQVLHLGWDLHIKNPKPHMGTFGVTLNAGIAFRVRSSYKESLNPSTYMRPFGVTQSASIAFRVGLFQSDFAYAYCV